MKLSEIRDVAERKFGVEKFKVENDEGQVLAEFYSYLCLTDDRKDKMRALFEKYNSEESAEGREDDPFAKFALLRDQLAICAVDRQKAEKFLKGLNDRDTATVWHQYESETQLGEADTSPS